MDLSAGQLTTAKDLFNSIVIAPNILLYSLPDTYSDISMIWRNVALTIKCGDGRGKAMRRERGIITNDNIHRCPMGFKLYPYRLTSNQITHHNHSILPAWLAMSSHYSVQVLSGEHQLS